MSNIFNSAPLYAPEEHGNPFIANIDANVEPSELLNILPKDFSRQATLPYDALKVASATAENFGTKLSKTQFVQNHPNLFSLDNILSFGNPNVKNFLAAEPQFLSEDDWKKSPYYRKDLSEKAKGGITVNLAKLLADQHDKDAEYQDISSRTDDSALSSMARIGVSFAGTAVDAPIYTLLGAPIEASGAAEMVINSIPIIKDSIRAGSALKYGIEGGLIGGSLGGLDYAKSKMFQEPTDATQIFYSALSGGLLGAGIGAYLPKLKSSFAKDMQKGEEFYDSPVTPEAHQAMVTAAISQLENDVVPNMGEYAKKAFFEKQSDIENQIKRNSGENDDLINRMKSQRDIIDDTIKKIDDKIPTITDEEELENLKSDRASLSQQLENHNDLIDMKSNLSADVPLNEAKTFFDDLKKPNNATDFNTNDDKEFELSSEQEIRKITLENADNIKKDFDNIKENLSSEMLKFKESADKIATTIDAQKEFIDGVKNCLGIK